MTPKTTKILITSNFFIIVLLILAFVLLWLTGVSSRHFSLKPKVYLLNQESNAYAVWQNSRVKGRTLIHLSANLPVALVSDKQLKELKANTPYTHNLNYLIKKTQKLLTNQNYLYASSRTNLIRRIIAVVPEKAWPEIKAKLKKSKVYSVHEHYASAWMDGMPITIVRLKRLPSIQEPVILNFSDTFWRKTVLTPAMIISILKRKKITSDVTTIVLPQASDPYYQQTKEKIDNLQYMLEQKK